MKHIVFISLILLALLLVVAFDLATDSYSLPWWTVDSGGGESIGTGYSLSGTIGQPDASPQLTGGSYTLVGGFWSGSGGAQRKVYLPLVLR